MRGLLPQAQPTPVPLPTPDFGTTPQELYGKVQSLAWTESVTVFGILAGFIGFSILIGVLFRR